MTALPIDSLRTPRFCGVPTFMRLPTAASLTGLDAAVIGLPSDSGSPYRTGARFAPNAIRGISAMLRPINPYRGNINIFERLAIADVGDAAVVPGYEEESLEALEKSVRSLIDADVTPFAIGGDHSVTLAELRAVASRFGPVALIHSIRTRIPGTAISQANATAPARPFAGRSRRISWRQITRSR